MTDYDKGMVVMDYLKSIGVDIFAIGEAISDDNLDKSFQLIQDNPDISKDDFLGAMDIAEDDEEYSAKLFSISPKVRRIIFEMCAYREDLDQDKMAKIIMDSKTEEELIERLKEL